MEEKHASMTKQYLKKNRWLETAQVSRKEEVFLPEEIRFSEDIRERISNSVIQMDKEQDEEVDTKFLLLYEKWYLVM